MIASLAAPWTAASSQGRERGVALLASLDADTVLLTTIRQVIPIGQTNKLALLQDEDNRFLIVDSSLKVLRIIGASGEGPGEFRRIGHLGWIGDTIWVRDPALARISYFDLGGKYVGSFRYPMEVSRGRAQEGAAALWILALLPDNRILGRAVAMGDGATPRWLDGGEGRIPLVQATHEGALVRVIAWESETPSVECQKLVRLGALNIAFVIPFYAQPLAAISPGAEWIFLVDQHSTNSPRGEAKLTVVRSSGDTVWQAVTRMEPVPIPRRVMDSAVNAVSRAVPGASSRTPNPTVVAALRSANLPTHFPVATRARIGDHGTAWIRLAPRDGQEIWAGFDRRGASLGYVKLPLGSEIWAPTDRGFVVVRQDADGLPIVERYAIR